MGEGVLQVRMFALFGAKKLLIFRNLCVYARTRGLSQCGHFVDKGKGGEGVNFSRFCADVLYVRPRI